ncbi:MAG: hypothetical protein KDI07_08140 [Anaerolineae bacterium]|nr:hypothetical protein [Anaerolineae bacterium]MCB9130980.1 hypothetical protein [Anaerolineales bacterium]MCB0227723.1 hypothetical protein [Anaerolineae bacterium]MCB0232859.1 hypothetical protein [Anaerolineae bacterium]MCB0238956.1 hypothetical protein [Anaerolineae bacterium]
MATTDERLRILKMIEQGQISAEDGARLLEALSSAEQPRLSAPYTTPSSGSARWLRVRVTDMTTGKHKVNVNIPMGLVNVGLKMGARFAPEMEGIDIDQLTQLIRSGATGKLIEVEDSTDSERVEIFVE